MLHGKPFWFSSLGQRVVHFDVFLKFKILLNFWGRTILVTSGVSENKTGTSKVGAISKAQKAQSFLNMPRMYS